MHGKHKLQQHNKGQCLPVLPILIETQVNTKKLTIFPLKNLRKKGYGMHKNRWILTASHPFSMTDIFQYHGISSHY